MNNYRFLVIFDAAVCNPMPDPCTGRPRTLSDGRGLISSQAINYRVKKYLKSDGEKILHFDDKTDDQYTVFGEIEAYKISQKEAEKRELDYLDTRLFGALDMASENGKKENKRSIGITLPVSFNHPRTYHPIIIRDIFLNRSYRVDSNEDGTNQGSSFANSSKIVEYGLYWMSGGINAIEAKRTNTTDEDIEKLIQALCKMFDNDYSSMRPLGSMTVRHVYVWKWDEKEKNLFENKIKDSIKVTLKEDVISPSCYEDYIIKEYDCGIEFRDYIN